jgi:hypothetical protein
METHVSVYFSEKPFIFYETNLPSRERFAGEPPHIPHRREPWTSILIPLSFLSISLSSLPLPLAACYVRISSLPSRARQAPMSPFVSMPSPLAACHMCFPGAAIATTRALRKLCAIHAHSGTRSCVSWGAKIRWNSPASATHVLVHCENPISTQPGSPLAMRIGSFVLLQIWPTPHTPDLARCRQRLLPCTRGSFRHVHLELIGQVRVTPSTHSCSWSIHRSVITSIPI